MANRYLLIDKKFRNDSFILHGVIKNISAAGKNDQIGLKEKYF